MFGGGDRRKYLLSLSLGTVIFHNFPTGAEVLPVSNLKGIGGSFPRDKAAGA
jgi:hypothetical protein